MKTLELPNLQKNQLDKLVQYETYRAGFKTDGVPSNLDIVRSLKGSVARRVALTAGKKARLRELEQKLAELKADKHDHPAGNQRNRTGNRGIERQNQACAFY